MSRIGVQTTYWAGVACLALAALGLGYLGGTPAAAESCCGSPGSGTALAACSPTGVCTACKNCNSCANCSKRGGTCSVCR